MSSENSSQRTASQLGNMKPIARTAHTEQQYTDGNVFLEKNKHSQHRSLLDTSRQPAASAFHSVQFCAATCAALGWMRPRGDCGLVGCLLACATSKHNWLHGIKYISCSLECALGSAHTIKTPAPGAIVLSIDSIETIRPPRQGHAWRSCTAGFMCCRVQRGNAMSPYIFCICCAAQTFVV